MSYKNTAAWVGVDFSNVEDIQIAVESGLNNHYSFITAPLFHPRLPREVIKESKRSGPLNRPDISTTGQNWGLVVATLSPTMNVDSDNFDIRKQSEILLDQELGFAQHVSVFAVLVPIYGLKNINLSRILQTHNKPGGPKLNYWVQIPTQSQELASLSYRSDVDETQLKENNHSTWDWWNAFHSICDYKPEFMIALEVSADLPDKEDVDRWLGEPVKCLIISTKLFLTNSKGYPVLSKAHQEFIKSFVKLDVSYIITDVQKPNQVELYAKFIQYLWQEGQNDLLLVKEIATGFEDFLQSPLQPLMDNLQAHTYDIFEQDGVKYIQYEKAVYYALLDMVPFEEVETRTIVIMVVGAGRGPLVQASIDAAGKAKRKIKVYAVEKNPNVIPTLEHKQKVWGDMVTIVASDMRKYKPTEKADILVSELLGSFGDNELSPECLDGVQHCLKEGGISIPESYSSYIGPIHSGKLYNNVREFVGDGNKHDLKHFETPYVAFQINKLDIAKPKKLFTFVHPNYDKQIDNNRYESLTFQVTTKCLLHGFSGSFETVLYKDITLSIVPDTHTKKMFSWFPVFFPIVKPILLQAGDEIELHFWRIVSKNYVWYEWTVAKPVAMGVHNLNGRSSKIGLY